VLVGLAIVTDLRAFRWLLTENVLHEQSPNWSWRYDAPFHGGIAASASAAAVGRHSVSAPIHSPYCRKCHSSWVTPRRRGRSCISAIRGIMQRKNESSTSAPQKAAAFVARSVDGCASCDPALCPNGTIFHRFDSARISPKVLRGMTYLLPSVSSSARIPPLDVRNDDRLLNYLTELWKNKSTDFLFEYNPSVVQLPNKVRRSLGLQQSDDAQYLASFRLSAANECFSDYIYSNITNEQWRAIRWAPNYLGLALLRSDLTVVPGYDVVVDVEKGIGITDDGRGILKPKKVDVVPYHFMDYRIYAARDGTIWLSVNAVSVQLGPLLIWSPNCSESAAISSSAAVTFPTIHGDPAKIQVGLSQNFSTVWNGGINGKNYALFQTDEVGSMNEVLAEINTWPLHQVARLRPLEHDVIPLSEIFRSRGEKPHVAEFADTPSFQAQRYRSRYDMWRRRVRTVGNMTTSEVDIERAHATVEELWFEFSVFTETQHGGACCISVGSQLLGPSSITEYDHVLVGVAHSKVPYRNDANKRRLAPHHHYVSSFYAFEPRPPHRIVAGSGYFCLGFPSSHEENKSGNPYGALLQKNRMTMNDAKFNCPQIHFVSGIAEKVGDEGRALIAYGVNDCASRIVEVSKRDIARLLLPGNVRPRGG